MPIGRFVSAEAVRHRKDADREKADRQQRQDYGSGSSSGHFSPLLAD